MGGLQLQGLTRHGLHLAHRFFQHGGNIHLGQIHIEVHDLHLVLQIEGGIHDIFHIAVHQGVADALPVLDAAADGGLILAEAHGVVIGRNDGARLIADALRHDSLHLLAELGKVIRVGAAAAAHGADAAVHHVHHLVHELLHRHVKHGLAILQTGQACVGLEHHRHGGNRQQPLHHAAELLGAERAVGAQKVNAQALQHGHHGLGGGARHQIAALTVGVGHQYGQIAVLLHCQDGSLSLVAVGHGLHHHQVYPCGSAEADSLGKGSHGIFKVQVAVGLQELAQGADVQGHELLLRGVALVAGSLGVGNGGGDDGLQLLVAVLQAVGAEGIGKHHVAACVIIGLVHPRDDLAVGHVPRLRRLAGLKSPLLQIGAAAAIEADDMVIQIL